MMQQKREATRQQMTQGRPEDTSSEHTAQLGAELEKWAKKIGPRSVAAAARFRKEPETQQE